MKKGQVFRSKKDYFKTVAFISYNDNHDRLGYGRVDLKSKELECVVVNVTHTPDGWVYPKGAGHWSVLKKEFLEQFTAEPRAYCSRAERYEL